MEPEALKSRPELQWYFESILLHFQRLSFSRKYSQMGPLPIDILTIFSYNDRIVGMDSEIFLSFIQALDAEFLKSKSKSEGTDGNS